LPLGTEKSHDKSYSEQSISELELNPVIPEEEVGGTNKCGGQNVSGWVKSN
jgi:hypothetical protein